MSKALVSSCLILFSLSSTAGSEVVRPIRASVSNPSPRAVQVPQVVVLKKETIQPIAQSSTVSKNTSADYDPPKSKTTLSPIVLSGLILAAASRSKDPTSQDGVAPPLPTCAGGPCSMTAPVAQFESTEYNRQYGLGMIGASTVYAYSGTGQGVNVSVVDSGIDASHPELLGRIAGSGHDYVLNTTNGNIDPNGHGTHVAGIIAANQDGVGMHGVAFNAQLLSYRIFGPTGSGFLSDSNLSSLILDSVQANSFILNNSWGPTGRYINNTSGNWFSSSSPQMLQTSRDVIGPANGAVMVFATGNDSQPSPSAMAGVPYFHPELEKGWLAVTAVDRSGVLAWYANQCGEASNWCLAAPGSDIYSLLTGGGYVELSGTSMATPHVSGALAALKSRFPNLSYQDIRDRLLFTADRTGIYSDSAKYGRGLLDLEAAASPVGVILVPTSEHALGGFSPLSNTYLTLDAAVQRQLNTRLLGQKMLVLDAYQRAPFYIDLDTRALPSHRRFKARLEDFAPAPANRHTITKQASNARFFAGLGNAESLDQALGLNLQWETSGLTLGSSYRWTLNALDQVTLGGWADSQSTSYSSHNENGFKSSGRLASALPLATHGLTVQWNRKLNTESDWSLGSSLALPEHMANGLQSFGAFALSPQMAWSQQASWSHKSTPEQGSESKSTLTATHYALIPSQSNTALLNSPAWVQLVDLSMNWSWKQSSADHQISLTLGKTWPIRSHDWSMSIPTSVQEDGSIGYNTLYIPSQALYERTRMSMSYDWKSAPHLKWKAFWTGYWGAHSNQPDDYLAGIGLNIQY